MGQEKELIDRVAERLIKLREKKGLTQAQVATAMGIGARSLWRWENAIWLPSGRHFEKLATFYETTTSALMR